VKELNLPPVKIHCSVLAEDAIKAAITDWRKRKGDDVGVEAPAKSKEA
jgi:nitrogen fixation NifU-like protein